MKYFILKPKIYLDRKKRNDKYPQFWLAMVALLAIY